MCVTASKARRMHERVYIPPTKRRAMTKARAAKIFLREQGRCYVCRIKLRVGADPYDIEHPESLAQGGSDADEDLRVICIPCHEAKTAADAKSKARRDRLVTATWKGKAKKRGFQRWRNMRGEIVERRD